MPVPPLGPAPVFPSPARAQPDGLLAYGGDLRPERLLAAYGQGIFPWPHRGLPMLWFSPDPRWVCPLDQLHVPRRLERRLRQGAFRFSLDLAFDQVIAACAAAPRPGQAGTWITPAMRAAYRRLHALGWAHSAEVWQVSAADGLTGPPDPLPSSTVQARPNQPHTPPPGPSRPGAIPPNASPPGKARPSATHPGGLPPGVRLVGGLYGVAIRGVFTGESMFTLAPDASKAAFVILVRQLQRWGFSLLDTQVQTPHVERLGARPMARRDFLALLASRPPEDGRPGPWRLDADLALGRDGDADG